MPRDQISELTEQLIEQAENENADQVRLRASILVADLTRMLQPRETPYITGTRSRLAPTYAADQFGYGTSKVATMKRRIIEALERFGTGEISRAVAQLKAALEFWEVEKPKPEGK